jgi:hypothetical protein
MKASLKEFTVGYSRRVPNGAVLWHGRNESQFTVSPGARIVSPRDGRKFRGSNMLIHIGSDL